MTITEVRDQFYSKYSLECLKRNVRKITIGDKQLAFMISEAQQDIQRRLSVVETYTTIILSDDSNTYALPANYGKNNHAYISGILLEEKPVRWIREQVTLGNSGYWYGIYVSGNTQYLMCPITSGTLTLYYHPDLRYYQPSLSTSQNWGSFSGTAFSGKLILPDRYDRAILLFLLSQIFDDYFSMYREELKSLRESREFSSDNAVGYSLGGVDVEDSRSSTSSVTISVESSVDAPIKRLRFSVSDDGSDAVVSYASGWTTTPTIVNNTSTIVITSADSEFVNDTQIQINNADFTYVLTGNETITITAVPSSSWGEVEVIIDIYS